MNMKRALGAFTAGLAAVGISAAHAADYNWTAGSGTDLNWSTADNWDPSGGPGTADQANFPNAEHTVKLDQNVTIAALSTNQKVIYNDDPSVTNTLTVTDTTYSMNTEAKGFVNVTTTGGGGYVKGTLKTSDGAKMTLHKADFSDNGDQHFISTGKGSHLKISAANFLHYAGKNTGVTFESYDEAELTLGKVNRNPLDPLTFKAVNANLYANSFTFGKALYITCCGSAYMDFNNVQPGSAGTTITFENGGTVRLRGATKLPLGNWASATLTLCDGCELQQYDGGSLTLNDGLTIKLAPTLASSETDGLIATRVNKTNTPITLNAGVKFEIDCSAFANHYGKKTMMVIDQKQPGSAATYNLPAADKVTLTGEGAANCAYEFTKDSTGKKVMLTITSRNIPEGTVAVIDGVAAFDSIQAAFDAAGAADVVTLVSDVELSETVSVTNAVAFDLGTFSVTGSADTALFSVLNGGALTVTGSGTIDGGNVAAVRATGGAFCVPAASTATFTSANDAVVLYNAGVAPTAEICGGNFASADGKPVASEAAAGFDPIAGFLEGGKYNKEPEAALIKDGYKAEQVGDVWEVTLEGPAMCMVGDRYFASLQKAYAALTEDVNDLFIISNATVAPLTMDRNITFWLDLKGHTLTPEEPGTIFTVKAGKVYLYDNPEEGDPAGALKGGVVVDGGTVSITMPIDADPALTVNGGTVTALNTMNGSVVLNGGSLTMNATVVSLGVAITANGGSLNVLNGSYTGVTSAFVAGSKFSGKCIDNGTFTSAIDSKYLKANRKMEQQGDVWAVLLVKDEAQVTYTWNDDASGAWTNAANWTAPAGTRCIGYPATGNNNSYLATAKFPSTIAEGAEVLVDGVIQLKDAYFSNAKSLKLVLDNGKIVLGTAAANGNMIGQAGSVDITFKGENPQLCAKKGWWSFHFGCWTDTKTWTLEDREAVNLTFELPATPWTAATAPISQPGEDSPVKFGSKGVIRVDMAKMPVPSAGTSVTNTLAYNGDGMRFVDWEKTRSQLELVNRPAGVKGELVYEDKSLKFIATKQSGIMLFVK